MKLFETYQKNLRTGKMEKVDYTNIILAAVLPALISFVITIQRGEPKKVFERTKQNVAQFLEIEGGNGNG